MIMIESMWSDWGDSRHFWRRRIVLMGSAWER
jgi:hypothetical protein